MRIIYVEYQMWPGGSYIKPYDGCNPIVCGDFCRLPIYYPNFEPL